MTGMAWRLGFWNVVGLAYYCGRGVVWLAITSEINLKRHKKAVSCLLISNIENTTTISLLTEYYWKLKKVITFHLCLT